MATLKTDLKQRQLEDYEAEINPRIRNAEGQIDLNGTMRFYGSVVRSAVNAGWFTDLTSEADVDGMEGKQVIKLAKEIQGVYDALTEIDPN